MSQNKTGPDTGRTETTETLTERLEKAVKKLEEADIPYRLERLERLAARIVAYGFYEKEDSNETNRKEQL